MEEENKIICEVKIEGVEEANQAVSQFGDGVSGLSTELNKLKEEPTGAELPEKKKKKEEEEGGQQGAKKSKKKEEDEAISRISGMMGQGLVQGLKSGDVKGALAGVGEQMATGMASSLVSKGIKSILSMIPGFGAIASFLPFQSEGLIRRPTMALVGEREPEFIVTQERMMGLLRGGRPGYGFGPGDFGSPNVNVAAPNVSVEVSVAPGVDADIQTAYRARAGEARLSQLEG
jgi:hypothetical protein